MLIYYGADVNAQNLNGNTPLHICAAEDQVCLLAASATNYIPLYTLCLKKYTP